MLYIFFLSLRNSLMQSELVAPCLKLLIDGLKAFKNEIMEQNVESILSKLLFLFFHFAVEYE